MVLIVAGAGRVLAWQAVRIGIGLVGGVFLLLVGAQVLAAGGRAATVAAGLEGRHPLWIGVLLTAGNPYFLLWWATVGLALAARAAELGAAAFAVFALVHWLCDLGWLEVLSLAGYKGSKLLGPGRQRVIALVCGAALVVFGVLFIWDAGRSWLR